MTEKRLLKIFASEDELAELEDQVRVIERYDGFVLVEATRAKAKKLSREYQVQDITALYTIPLARNRKINTSIPRIDKNGVTHVHPAYRRGVRLKKGPHHYLVQFIGPIKEKWLRSLRRTGGEPRGLHSGFVYIVRADQAALRKIVTRDYVRWVGHLPHKERIGSAVISDIEGKPPPAPRRTRLLPRTYVVEFFTSDNTRKAVRAVKRLGFEVLAEEPLARILVVKTAPQRRTRDRQLNALAAVHGVRKIRERALNRLSNDVATRILSTSKTMGNSGLGLSGRGEIVAVCDSGLDTGDPDDIHLDFRRRVISIMSYPINTDYGSDRIKNPAANDGGADLDSGHGTHVAGSVLGDGSAWAKKRKSAPRIRGCAYRAELVFQAVEQELDWKHRRDLLKEGRFLLAGIPVVINPIFRDAYREGARIHTNSWNGGRPGVYDHQCEELDEFVWKHQDFCVLFAAGNDGSDKNRDGIVDSTSIQPPAIAKNCITVGACENRRAAFKNESWGSMYPKDFPVAPFKNDPVATDPNQVAAFSSRGPTNTGRFKPDVVAPGTFVLSTRSAMMAWDNTGWALFRPQRDMYFYLGGTSMATPLVAGVLALLREYLRKNAIATKPSAALLKAALVAGARRLPGYGEQGAVVDNDQGYGRVDLDAVLAPPTPASTRFRDVSPGLRTGESYWEQFRIRSGRRPLRVALAYADRGNTPHLVHNLNLRVVSPSGREYFGNQKTNGRGEPDRKNNVELVHVPKPGAGIWDVEVRGESIPTGPQPFALVSIGHF